MSKTKLSMTVCGGRLDWAVQAAVTLWKSCWVTALRDGVQAGPDGDSPPVFFLDREQVCAVFAAEAPRAVSDAPGLWSCLAEICSSSAGAAQICMPAAHFCLSDLVQDLLAGEGQRSDLVYLCTRELRRRLRIRLSADTISAINQYTEALQRWLAANRRTGQLHYSQLLLLLQLEKGDSAGSDGQGALDPDSYFQLACALGWVRPGPRLGDLHLDLGALDATAMADRLFGFPTEIAGLDLMFGGAGVLLVDAPDPETADAATGVRSQPIGGRTVLVTGPYGTGKSTLTLQVALEVARKGGVALVAAMEQTTEECLYAVERLGVPTHSPRFRTVNDLREAMPTLLAPYDGRGALVFLPLRGSQDQTSPVIADAKAAPAAQPVDIFVQEIRDRLNWMKRYPLRLLIIDPVNSVLEDDPVHQLDRRQKLVEVFGEAKRAGINTWLIAERNQEDGKGAPFEENIADAVLYLGVDRTHQFQRRTIEVKKSRLQHEAPGRHSVMFSPGQGIRIYPSSTSLARIFSQQPSPESSHPPIHLDIPGLDRILGPASVHQGDLIALNGESGSSRTLVGIHFLFGTDPGVKSPDKLRSLFVADAREGKMRSMVELIDQQTRGPHRAKSAEQIQYCSIAPGWVEPGEVLQSIREQLDRAAAEGAAVDRVLIADVPRWETSMPLLHADPTFGVALISLLRQKGATSAVLTSPLSEEQPLSYLTDLIIRNADCLLSFEKFEFRGQLRFFVRAVRTHDMAHRRDAFELVMDHGGVRVEPSGALLRKDAAGNVHSIKIRLAIHSDSPRHKEFNDRLVGAIETSLAEVIVEEQTQRYDPEMFVLSSASGVDEVQVMQVDEFQLPAPDDEAAARSFLEMECGDKGLGFTPEEIDEYIDRLKNRVLRKDRRGHIAVPFYENVSLLAWHTGHLGEDRPPADAKEAWKWLQQRTHEWHSRGGDYLFFSCPLAQPHTMETYNCLYFEILRAFQPDPPAEDCKLVRWITSQDAKTAAGIFCDLCARSHAHELRYFERARSESNQQPLRMFDAKTDCGPKGPVVWRHWYNTLSQMMWDLPHTERAHIEVQPIFGKITTAGEWYLAIPAYSAAPEVAWQIIKMITAPDRELQRIYRGVGLPTRSSFYKPGSEKEESSLSPFFHLSRSTLRDLVNGAFQRSSFPCYQVLSETISAHLVKLLELPVPPGGTSSDIKGMIDRTIDHLGDSIRYIQSSRRCTSCGR